MIHKITQSDIDERSRVAEWVDAKFVQNLLVIEHRFQPYRIIPYD